MCTSTGKLFNLFILTILSVSLGLTVSFGQTITGTVYRDFNSDGAYTSIPASGTYTYGEPGIAGIIIKAYNASGVVSASATTSATGSYTLSVGSTSQFRVEFTNLVAGDYESFRGTGSATSIQFVNGGSTNINLGVNYPASYCGVVNPYMATSCYTNGDPTQPSSLTTNPANDTWMVGWQYDGATTGRNTELAAGSVGTTWGLAYHRTSKLLFAAAFMKRHSGFGAGGPGQIYSLNVANPALAISTIAPFVNLQSDLGITVGTDPRSTTALPTNKLTANHDAAAFDLVGKMSLGDMDISDDDKTLWVMNLYDNALYELPIGSPATKPTTYTKHILPNPGCVNGSFRAFATSFYRGKVYVGAVCTAEGAGGTAANLTAYVYAHDPAGAVSNFTQVLTFPLNYSRGYAASRGTGTGDGPAVLPGNWRPWIDQWTDIPSSMTLGAYDQTSYPQPVLSDIEFDVNGEMVVGFFDRFGHQAGNENYSPITSSTLVYEAVAAGDLLRAGRKTDGTYQIENNASVTNNPANGAPAVTTSTAAVNQNLPQGPGGGEYYWQDMYGISASPNSTTADGGHQEVLVGGLTTLPGRGQVVSTSFDPFSDFRAAGARYFDNLKGTATYQYQVLSQDGGLTTEQRVATFGKAASLGDLEIFCDQPPIEIGNRVWVDTNNNGIQDPGEAPLAGIVVTLKGPGITGSVSVTTNAAGEYYFSSAISGTAATGLVYSLTGLTSGGSYSLTFPTSASAGALTLSGKPDSATGTNADNIDTDPNLAGTISFTLGQAGQNNFSYDAGYVPPASLGDYVFVDANKDGIQDTGDTPIPGVVVTLYTNGVASATTVTNASGLYSFTGLTPGNSLSYSVGFATPTGYTATTPLSGTDKTKDSDPINGITASITLAAGENNPTLDAGFYLLPAGLGDYVFLDANKDGIQNTGDTPIAGVVVTLYTNGVASATTVTNASGLYSFTGLAPGSSLSYSVGFTAPAGYTATLANAGTDDTKDSDADVITGKTQSVTLAPGEFNPTLDAGFYLPTAGLGDYVFLDANKDGIQNTGDTPIAGVTVTLYTNGVASATTVTNASGLYSFTGLTPGSSNSYVVGFTAPAGMTATLANAGTDDTKDSDADPITGKTQSVTLAPDEFNPTLDAGFYTPTAGLGDYVFLDANKDGIQNTGDTPIAGVVVTLYTNGVASATTVTNASGLYSFTGLTPGSSNSYVVGFTAPAGMTATLANAGSDDTKDSDADLITGKTQSVTLAPDEFNPTLDAGFYTPTAGLGDYVFFDANKDGIQNTGDTPIAGVAVTLYTNGVASATTVTNASGLYSFTGLTPGSSNSYVVGFTAPAGMTATLANAGTDDTKDSDADPITGKTQSVTLAPGEFNPTLDAGFYIPSAGLGDYVFLDANKDGIQNTGDTPIAGVVVTLYTNGVASATTVTNASGLYSFTGLTPGTSNRYVVGFTAPAGYTTTLANAGTDDTKDSNADVVTGKTQSVTLAPGEFNPTLDAGFYTPTAGLGDYVFFDANKDGIQNTGDTPIAGVVVTLYTNGVASATTVTNASGLYSFTGLTPGSSNSYVVGFTAPAGMTATLANAGTDDTKDSDADPITGKTQSVTLAPGEFNPTLDAGFYIPSAGLGDYVFLDANKDGIQNTGDTPIAGVVVTLYTNGVASATTVTNASGLYSFTGLTPGTSNRYVVGFTAPAGYTTTLANAGTDDTKDSNADVVTGKTQSVTLAPGEFNPTLDAGFYTPTAGLGDYVFFDANKDGIQNTGDTPIAGVVVTLYTNGVASATTVTNASGLYSFTGLTPGSSNSYVVGFTAPAGMTATIANAGTDDTLDSDADVVTGKTQSVTLAPGEFNPTLDAGFYTPKAKSPKLTITKQVDKSKAKLHDVLTYTLAVTNSGDGDATNILVTDSTSTGLTYVINSATNPAGTTFTQGTPISTWTIGTLTAGQSLSMTFQATADSSGILYNKAIVAGDTATVCTSIPVVMCAGDVYTFQLTAPAGRSSYQWFKDGVAISGQTTNVLEVTAPGTYSLAVDNTSGKCPDFSCCPFIIEEDSLPSFKATAVPVTCTGSTTLANGQIVLSGFNGANTYQYSLGSSFNAATSLSGVAKVIPGDGLLVGNLGNPSVATAYTIRVYNASGCYTDVTVLLMPTVCGCPADICVPFVLSQTKRAPRIGDPR